MLPRFQPHRMNEDDEYEKHKCSYLCVPVELSMVSWLVEGMAAPAQKSAPTIVNFSRENSCGCIGMR